jgi:plasmid stabilization system protein ParE
MTFSVVVSERAERNLEEIINYLEREWSARVRDKYLLILKKKLKLISEKPWMYPASLRKKSVHRCVITKHSILYYRVQHDHVEIITIQDGRRDPKKVKT